MDLFPWLMYFDLTNYGRLRCNIVNPCTQKVYNVEIKQVIGETYYGAEPCASRYGWVLFSKRNTDDSLSFFLYSPFTNEAIEFPVLQLNWEFFSVPNNYGIKATFSLSPSSRDCVVIVLLSDADINNEIRTCRPSDRTWMKFKCNDRMILWEYAMDVALAGEFLFCAFGSGKIGVFGIKHQKWWKLLSGQGPMTFCSSFVSSSNGDILLTTYADDEEYKRFWKFDSLENRWIEVRDRNETIFVCGFPSPTYNHISFSVPALGNAGEFAGKICRIKRCHIKFPKLYGGCISEEENYNLNKVWIEPPILGKWRASDLLQSNLQVLQVS